MRIYCVAATDYEYHGIVAVYLTREEAERECKWCCEKGMPHSHNQYSVEEHEVGVSRMGFIVTLTRSGRPDPEFPLRFDDLREETFGDEHGVHWYDDGIGGAMVWTRTPSTARKQWLASKAKRESK